MGFPLPPAFSHGMTSLRPGTKDFDIGGGSVVAIGLYVAQPLYDSHPAVHLWGNDKPSVVTIA